MGLTTLHYQMLVQLGKLSEEIAENPENKSVLLLKDTGSSIINSILIEMSDDKKEFSIIEAKINDTSLIDIYKKALIASFKKLYDNEVFEGDMIFNVFNVID